MSTWQHDETGRICNSEECPGARWFEVPWPESEMTIPTQQEEISAIVAAAVLAEREACAAVLTDYAEKNRDSLCRARKWAYTKQLASMIRERGKI